MNEIFEEYFKIEENPMNSMVLYATSGGKYIRSNIILEFDSEMILSALAVELLHSASLVIDDLPCMDNDTTRRGKESTFKKFGEATSILLSAYMVNQALIFITREFSEFNQSPTGQLKDALEILISKINSLLIGQMYDVDNLQDTEMLIELKTCALFELTFALPFLKNKMNADDAFVLGKSLGYMYQIWDDFEDLDEDQENPSWKNKNIVAKEGPDSARILYKDNLEKFVDLLKKYNKNDSVIFKKILSKIEIPADP